jgi:hypothetical protein
MKPLRHRFEYCATAGKTPFCVLPPLEEKTRKTLHSPVAVGTPDWWVHPTATKQEDCAPKEQRTN